MILSFILFIIILSIIKNRHWLVTLFWLIFGMPIYILIISSLFYEIGIRRNLSDDDCEIIYNGWGPEGFCN